MAYTSKNFARGSLASVLSAGATQLIVSTTHTLPELGTFVLVIWDAVIYPNPADDPNTEIVEAQYSGTPNVFDIVRGKEDTVDVEHAAGSEVALHFTAGMLNTLLNDESVAAGITSGNVSNWNTAYGWGNHAGLYDSAGEAALEVGGHELTHDHSLLHSPVTLGTANGLSLVGQVLSLPTTASPTFAGLTLTGLSGILQATAGVVSGSATLDDVPDGASYERVAANQLSSGIYIDATTAVKGIASFDSDSFSVTSGAVSLVAGGGLNHNDLSGLQGGAAAEYYHLTGTEHGYVSGANAQSVLTTASPTFAGLTSANSTTPTIAITHTTDTSYGLLRFYEAANVKAQLLNIGSNFSTAARRNNLELRSIDGAVVVRSCRLGVAIDRPAEDIHAADTVRADTAFNLNGTDGVSDSGAGVPTALTLSGGIVTAVTKNDWLDQSVKQTASPTFAGLTSALGRINARPTSSTGLAEAIRFGRTGSDVRFHSIYRRCSEGVDSYLEFRIHNGGVAPYQVQNTVLTLYGATPEARVSGICRATGIVRSDDKFNVNGTDGIAVTDTVITALRDNAGQLQYKSKTITFTGGIRTATGAESDWTNVPSV